MTIEVKCGDLIYNGSPLIKYRSGNPMRFSSLKICYEDATEASSCSCSEIETWESKVSKQRKKEISLHKRVISFIDEVKALPDGNEKKKIINYLDMQAGQSDFNDSPTPWQKLIRKIKDKNILFCDGGTANNRLYYILTIGTKNLKTERIVSRFPSRLADGNPMIGKNEEGEIFVYAYSEECLRDLISHSEVVSKALNIGREELIQKLNSQLRSEVQK